METEIRGGVKDGDPNAVANMRQPPSPYTDMEDSGVRTTTEIISKQSVIFTLCPSIVAVTFACGVGVTQPVIYVDNSHDSKERKKGFAVGGNFPLVPDEAKVRDGDDESE
ncbi:hypothetical protein OIU79_028361 [Salix purpurea]|uniref:Uncharacterized protein n=1 Tax=Salix purpurea TaxID=77065 RepID=A0A9Q1A2W5_SALPP|nr:hypothetical protein OIU79_028361 [Salix purpurea]